MEISVFYCIADAKQVLLKRRPDLLLVDWNVLDGSGNGLCIWIRRLWGNQLPILPIMVFILAIFGFVFSAFYLS